MRVFIDKKLFSNNKNLILEKNSFYWSESDIEDYDLRLDSEKKNSLNSFLNLYGVDPIKLIDENYLKIAETLNVKNPEWKFLLPKKLYSKKTKIFQEKLVEIKDFLFKNDYIETFSAGNSILNSLHRIKPDGNAIREFLIQEKNPTLRSIVSSFTPLSDGYCSSIKYDRTKTVTGRLIIENGPQVLLLPREMKSIFKSRYGKDGKIICVDFISLEPRFTKLLTCEKTEVDIYTDIIEKTNVSCTRKQIKLAVLATLFGAGLSKLTEIVGKEAFVVKKVIKGYFSLDKVLKMTGDYKSGKIDNYFGRPISLKKSSSNVAINNYVQSSSVDVSLMGFSKFINKGLPESVKPLCIIHDALVLDVRNDDIDEISGIINKGVHVDSIGHFFLGFELYESNS